MTRRIVLSSLFAAAVALSAAAEPRVVFERARVLSGTGTVTQIARQYEVTRVMPRVTCTEELPIHECFEHYDFSSSTETSFGQLYEITVLRRNHGIASDGAPFVGVEEVQRELFATDLGAEAEAALEERLVEHVRRLHPLAAAFPFAARITGRDPLPFSFLYDDSATPTWICVERNGARDVTYLLPVPEIGGYTVGNGPEDVKAAVCDALAMTITPEGADQYETGIGVDTLRTFRLTLDEAWDPGSDDERAFQPPPATYGKRVLAPDEEPPRLGYFPQGGRTIAAALEVVPDPAQPDREDRVLRAAVVEPLTIAPPRSDAAVWLARWRGAERERSFGSDATETPLATWEVLAAWLPLADPGAPDARPRPPRAGWLEAMQQGLEVANEIEPQTVVEGFVRALESTGPEGDGLVILCADGRPRYALTPFTFEREIVNGRDVCDAVARLARERLSAD